MHFFNKINKFINFYIEFNFINKINIYFYNMYKLIFNISERIKGNNCDDDDNDSDNNIIVNDNILQILNANLNDADEREIKNNKKSIEKHKLLKKIGEIFT